MTVTAFYGHFAAAMGTLFLIALALSFLAQEHIDLGAFGLCGFPIIAFLYAVLRRSAPDPAQEIDRLRRRIAELEAERAGTAES